MKSVKFIHTADWHLAGNNRLSDFENSISQVVSFAKENKVDFILHGGDVFNKRTPDNYARETFYRFVKNISPIKVIVITGNHDSDIHSSLSPLKFLSLENLIVLNTLGDYTFSISDIPVSILSIPDLLPRLSTESIKKAVDMFLDVNKDNYKIILGHFSVIGAKTPNYIVTENSKEFVLSKDIIDKEEIDYVALGHIHLRQDIGNIHYSGGIERINFGEKEYEPGFYFIEVTKLETRYNTKAKFIPLQVRPMVDLILDQDNFLDQAKTSPDNAFVRMFYNSDKHILAIEEIKKILEVKGCVLKEPVNFIRKQEEQIVEIKNSSGTWEDLVKEEIEKSKDLDKEFLYSLFNKML